MAFHKSPTFLELAWYKDRSNFSYGIYTCWSDGLITVLLKYKNIKKESNASQHILSDAKYVKTVNFQHSRII